MNSPSPASKSPTTWAKIRIITQQNQWIGPWVALVVVYLLFVFLSPDTFARAANLLTMARQTAVVGLVASGMTLIMIMGGIDLSVGSVVALSTVFIALGLRNHWSPALSAVFGIVIGGVCGAGVGLGTTKLKVTPFIVSLGAMSLLRGVAKGLAKEQKIDAPAGWLGDLAANLPPERSYLLLPPSVTIWLLLSLLVAGLLNYTRFGRYVIAIGSNEKAARISGIAVERIQILAYSLAGMLTGIAGVLEFSTLTVGDPTDSLGLELNVIAAVVIGGGSLSGGEGSVIGTLAGAMLMTVIKTGCTHIGLPNWVQEVITGAIIVVAMAVDHWRNDSK
jgi:ribose/xylose/arabinose/galactoside ABC-type transport system permease subunit